MGTAAELAAAALVFGLSLLHAPGVSAQPPPENIGGHLADPSFNAPLPEVSNIELADHPGDAGGALLLTFDIAETAGAIYLLPQVQVGDGWQPTAAQPIPLAEVPTADTAPQLFGYDPDPPTRRYIVIDGIAGGGPEPQPLEKGTEYAVRMSVVGPYDQLIVDAGTAAPLENSFRPATLNTLLISLIFAAIMLTAVQIARANPSRLFIRRIAGLEAVDEAIGRATEMGKAVMQVNGLDPLTTLSTVAAVNILGQIARKVAHYDSRLMVPSFDPVVMTVSQETVRAAYMEEGRPDAYREDDVFFVTDQQFSYVASVCGIILRDRPAAIFLLGYFYAESLLLAETGQSTGAIQIAGTDAQAQLPFFITTCDYTLIGEELYAASAYLSRDPLLLGSLKGLDVAKALVMGLILIGTLLATADIPLLTRTFTPLN